MTATHGVEPGDRAMGGTGDRELDAPDASRRGADQPWSWHASRAAALLLVVLVPLHFVVTFVIDDIGTTTARSMSERLDDPTWRLLTWLTVALALLHALLGADASLRRRRRGATGVVLTAAVGVAAGALLAAASWVLLTHGAR